MLSFYDSIVKKMLFFVVYADFSPVAPHKKGYDTQCIVAMPSFCDSLVKKFVMGIKKSPNGTTSVSVGDFVFLSGLRLLQSSGQPQINTIDLMF